MAKTNNILGVDKLLLGAPGDGVMGTTLTEFQDIEVNSLNVEGSTGNETTIPTEADDAYITLSDTASPTTVSVRLYGVAPDQMVMLAGGSVGGAALASPVNAAFTAGTGTLAAATYYYRVSAINAEGETLASAETSLALASVGGVNVNWGSVAGATGYKVYGRSIGAEEFIASVGNVTTFLDDGSITPSGALPTVNSTGQDEGSWLAPGTIPNIYLSAKILGKPIDNVAGSLKIPYGKVTARLQGNITKNGLPAVDVSITANTPETSGGVKGSPFIIGAEAVV